MKKIISVTLIFAIMFSMIPHVVFATENTTEFAGGDGSMNNPFKVETLTHLNKIRLYPDSHFIQTADIESVGDWTPISKFSGVYDGGGHTISNIRIIGSVTSGGFGDFDDVNFGFFATLTGTVRRLGVVDCDVSVSSNGQSTTVTLGTIAGNSTGTISECFATGSVDGTVTQGNPINWGSISAGGIAGIGNVDNCYSNVNVTGKGTINSQTIRSIDAYVGSLSGQGTVIDSYSRGPASGTSIGNGPFGEKYVFYVRNSSNTDYLHDFMNFKDWDFNSLWVMDPTINNGFPQLQAFYPLPQSSEPFDSGFGYTSHPYLVSTAKHLNEVKNNLAATYIQTNDIDIGSILNWVPIGENSNNAFTGTYNGSGFIIRNLKVDKTVVDGDAFAGLFGAVGSNGKILGLGVENGVVSGTGNNAYVGGIAGYSGGTIELCYYTGNVNSYAVSNTRNISLASGLVGYNVGSLSVSYSNANIDAQTKAPSAVSSAVYSGGVAGFNLGGTITHCYSGGLGRAIGENTGAIVSIYYLSDQPLGNFGTHNEQFQMTSRRTTRQVGGEWVWMDTYKGWDFKNTWVMIKDVNYGYPILRLFIDTNDYFASGVGSVENPFKVSNAVHLNNVRDFPDDCFVQTGNIDLGSIESWNSIGTQGKPFYGTYDGYGNSITRLKITGSVHDSAGLFGYMQNGKLRNIKLSGGSIDVSHHIKVYAGGVVGEITGGVIENCENSNPITAVSVGGTYPFVNAGGIVGSNDGGRLSNLRNTGDVFASAVGALTVRAGGIVGSTQNTDKATTAYNSNISASSNTGNVTATNSGGSIRGTLYAGGIAGLSGRIDNSYNRGAVTVNGNSPALMEVQVGGIAGFTGGLINYCYNTGQVNTNLSAVPTYPLGRGGLTGRPNIGSLKNYQFVQPTSLSSVWDSSQTGYEGYGQMRTEEQLKQQTTYLTNLGNHVIEDTPLSPWNFSTIWEIKKGVNGGFPYHKHETHNRVEILSYNGAEVIVRSEQDFNNINVWGAVYDSNGLLTEVKKIENVNLIKNDEVNIPLSLDSASGVKIFIWTENMQPLCVPWTE